jgi:hypothetical protein
MVAFIHTTAISSGSNSSAVSCRQQSWVFHSQGYRAAKTRPPSDRAIRDELLIDELKTVHQQNSSVYGVNKMH